MKKKLRFPLFCLLLVLILTNAGNYWYFNVYCRNIYKERSESLSKELDSCRTQIYTALYDIPAGTFLTSDMVAITDGYVSSHIGLFTAADLGRTSVTGIEAGTILYSCMVYDESVEVGNTAEYNEIILPSSATVGCYIDVRIRFKNGNDYIVVSKTKLSGIGQYNTSLLTLTEKEHQYLSSAIVDASMYAAELYATIYSSPEIQEAAMVTYVPRKANLPLIYSGSELLRQQDSRDRFEYQLQN